MLLTVAEGKGNIWWWQRQAFGDETAVDARKQEALSMLPGDMSAVVRELWDINIAYISTRGMRSLRWPYLSQPHTLHVEQA